MTTPIAASSDQAVRLPRSTSGNEPQHLLITVLGDYWFRRSEALPSASLIDLMAVFDVPESAARQALRRLAARNLLIQHRSGRTTGYGFPPRTEGVISRRLESVLGYASAAPDWDGEWTVVTFSIPRADKNVRNPIRARLRSMGFAMLHDAVWVSPFPAVEQTTALLDELSVTDGFVFRSRVQPRPGEHRSIAGIYRLDALAKSFRDFSAAYADVDAAELSDTDALTLRTRLTTDWLALRSEDPNLPAEILPADWPRAPARAAFVDAYEALADKATRGFQQVIGKAAPQLADLASHHAVGERAGSPEEL